ncbi:MAG: hypothetical protein ABTA16_04270 [Niallia sp.]
MLTVKKIMEKCKKQKTISTHLVLATIESMHNELAELHEKHKDLQHYSNKHQQLMKTEIQQLKEKNRKLREDSART